MHPSTGVREGKREREGERESERGQERGQERVMMLMTKTVFFQFKHRKPNSERKIIAE
jgi:hypothetical protein